MLTLNTERQLASVRTVKSVKPIEGADRIEEVVIDGWSVVAQKGAHKVGDSVLYVEIDAALPLDDPRFKFLGTRSSRIQSREGTPTAVHVLKTIRLKGVYSQGICFPVEDFQEATDPDLEGYNLDHVLGIEKWEPPIPAGNGQIEGAFPNWLRKTDAERVQNIDYRTWIQIQRHHFDWEPTEKIDGSSATFWKDLDGTMHAASRNWEVKEGDNNFWNAIWKYSIDVYLNPGEWIQGEICGPGIQNNPLGLDSLRFFAFNLGNRGVDGEGSPHPQASHCWPSWAENLKTPIYDISMPLTIEDAVFQADGIKSMVNPKKNAEGIVWTHRSNQHFQNLGDRHVFKVISNKYLLKADQ